MNGSCSCGQIKVSIPKNLEVGVCHCSDCRKATGNTYTASFTVGRSAFELEGSPQVYTVTGSSGQEVRRYFCGTCGSPIYTECQGEGEVDGGLPVHVKIGLFPSGSIPAPSTQIFAKDMESWEKPYKGAEVYQTQ